MRRDLSISALNKTFEKRFPRALPIIKARQKEEEEKKKKKKSVAFGVVSKSICVITIKRDARRKQTRGGGQRESKEREIIFIGIMSAPSSNMSKEMV